MRNSISRNVFHGKNVKGCFVLRYLLIPFGLLLEKALNGVVVHASVFVK